MPTTKQAAAWLAGGLLIGAIATWAWNRATQEEPKGTAADPKPDEFQKILIEQNQEKKKREIELDRLKHELESAQKANEKR